MQIKSTFIALFSLLSFSIVAQNIAIDYQNPVGLTVCDTATFEVTVSNNSPNTLSNPLLTIDLPTGVNYNTIISNATVSDISDLNNPILSLGTLLPGAETVVTYTAITSCELVDAINTGFLFTNTMTVSSGSTSQVLTTLPYTIETGLLIVLSSTNDVLVGTTNDVLTRTFTITNTRLGALKSFNFNDMHEGGINIDISPGSLVQQDASSFIGLLDGDDFMTIGDGDELFELDEEIIITETILITDCGYTQNSTASNITLSWGCHGANCQIFTTTAEVQFTPTQDNPLLTFVPMPSIPSDFCGEGTYPQSVLITNEGTQSATAIKFSFISEFPNSMGADPGSFKMDSSGVITDLIPIPVTIAEFPDCPDVPDAHANTAVTIPILAAGESIEIYWETRTCDEECSTVLPTWLYVFQYNNFCPENDVRFGGNTGYQGGVPLLLQDEVTYNIGVNFVDDGIYTMNYELFSTIIDDSTGVLNLEFVMPCGVSWANSDLVLDGQSPFSIDIQENPEGEDTVNLQYTLPFSTIFVTDNFQIEFNCEPECVLKPECNPQYNTSCPPQDICIAPVPPSPTSLLDMQVYTSIILDETVDSECAIRGCLEFFLDYECEVDPICEYDILGFALHELESERINYGLPDNDDDRFADAGGELQPDLIRKDRLIPGDYLSNRVSGVVTMEDPTSTFENAQINFQMQAQSVDFGLNGGMAFGLEGNIDLFGLDFLTQIDQTVRIYDASSGDYYDCPINPAALVEPAILTIEVPNTRPQDIENVILYRDFIYNISVDQLGGCVPNGFLFQEGDSIIFEAQHRMTYNIQTEEAPLMINLRAVSAVVMYNDQPPGEDPFACACQSNFLQYSGYKYKFGLGDYEETLCEPFTSTEAPYFSLTLGVPNFFPFEFRHLGTWEAWEVHTPERFSILNPVLVAFGLQGGPVLDQNVPLSAVSSNGIHAFDLASYQVPLPDEGFYAEFDFDFESNCLKFGGDLGLGLRSVISFNDLLPEIENPIDTLQKDSASILTEIPFINLTADQTDFTSLNNLATWEVELQNSSIHLAENVYIQLISASGLVTNLELIDANTGQVIPNQGGIHQLGNWEASQTNPYTINATNNSCTEEFVQVIFGWNCEPYLNNSTDVCGQNTLALTTTSLIGELEMDITSPTATFDLCDTVDYHTIEVFNAQVGAVFNVLLNAQLPSGLSYAPGTAQIEYPTGSGYVPLADPTSIGGNAFQWDIAALENTIGMNGLLGVQSMPEHSVSIRFKSMTSCGFISSSPVIFTVSAIQNCLAPTNTITRAGDPINITGIVPTYTANVNISVDAPTVYCGEDLTLDISMDASELTQPGDSIFIYLPTGISFVPGSFVAGANAINVAPLIDLSSNSEILKWPLPINLEPNTLLDFQITTTGYGIQNCDANTITVQTLQSQEALCVADNSLCSVLAETGSTSLLIELLHPILELNNLTLDIAGASSAYSVDLANSGAVNINPIIVELYLDANGDGIANPGETLLDTQVFNGSLGTNETEILTGNIDISYEMACNVIAVVDGLQNCICNSTATTVSQINHTISPYVVCAGAPIEVGIMQQLGHIYEWDTDANLDCADCSPATFTFDNTSADPAIFDYVLSDNFGSCVIDNYINVTVLSIPQTTSADTTICAGAPLLLTAPEAVSYNWSGEGITNPNQQNQTVMPTMSGIYTVEITDSANCSAISTVNVTTLPAPTANAGTDVAVCEGEIASLNATAQQGLPFTWSPANALDDATILNPTVTTTETTLFTLGVTNNIGCTTTSDVLVTFNPIPNLAVSGNEQLCIGDSIQLVATGADNYTWSPNDGSLSCLDCPNPWVQTNTSTTYTLNGINDTECASSTTVEVTVFGTNQSTAADISICEEDLPIVIHGTSVTTDGAYCETFSNFEGCDSLSCVNLTINPRNSESIQEVCIGDSILINGTTYFENAQVCEDFTSSLGCDSTHCINLSFIANPIATIQLDYSQVEVGEPVQLDGPSFYDFYEWSPAEDLDCSDCEDPIFTPSADGNYEFTLVYGTEFDSILCRSEVPITIPVLPMCDPQRRKIPTAFSPNGDGVDDRFGVPTGLGLEAVGRIQIYNRWGEKVFDELGDSEWDGTVNGKPSPSGVYIYFVDLSCDGTEGKRYGEVTLLR